jgi:hypothetical protein
MPRKPVNRIVRAITNAVRERDRLEMKAVGALLSMVEPPRRGPQRRRAPARGSRLRGSRR